MVKPHVDDIGVNTSDKRWHTSTYDWHSNDIRMACEWHTTDVKNIKLYKRIWSFFIFIFGKKLLNANGNYFWLIGCSHSHIFVRILVSSTIGPNNLNNLKGGPYYILQPASALIFYIWFVGAKPFCIPSSVKIYVVSICSFNQKN